jgi:hypothetical protein
MYRKIVAAAATALLVAGLSAAGAQSASASPSPSVRAETDTAFCDSNFYTLDWESNSLPNQILYCQMQAGPASEFGYTGPVNGIMGVNSWKGVMAYLAYEWGYTGPVNGIPGVNTYKAMQRAGNEAAAIGSSVTVNGTMNLQSWKNFALCIEGEYWGD